MDRPTPPRGSPVSLAGVRHIWNRFAELDASEAIARRPAGTRAPWRPEEFLASGREIVASFAARVEALGGELRGDAVLDSGCGVGRMAPALLERYVEYVGVDISERMLALAPGFVNSPRARWLHAPQGDLSVVGDRSFALVWSYVVLQHLPPPNASALLSALSARVAPGGWLCVQVPERNHSDVERIYGRRGAKGGLRALLPPVWLERWREWRNGAPRCDMFGLDPDMVRRVIEEAGLRLVAAERCDDTLGLVESRRYFARRDAHVAR
jgi:SAM-dependent methyltransferase